MAVPTKLPRLATLALLVMVASACSSNTELERIDTRLSDIQVQVLQLQKQSPSKAELQALEASLVARIDTLVQAQAGVRSDVDALTRQVERLQAKLEETHFELAKLSQQLEATNEELQVIRTVAEEARSTSSSPPADRMSIDSSDPRALYETAYNDYKAGNYDLAILAFRQYVESYPSTDLADNATYWIGECYYRRSQFQRAIREFDAVLERFERSDRATSAQLKKAYAHLELGQREKGVEHLQRAACDHEGTDEALLARKRLQELGFDADCANAL
jgi:tol-pal system protein YbgF